jgi:hypothetical protein
MKYNAEEIPLEEIQPAVELGFPDLTVVKDGIKRIHVNQGVIRSNRKYGKTDDPLTVKVYKDGKRKKAREKKTSDENVYGHRVIILDANGNPAAHLIYRPHDPLSCGAQIWIETENEVLVSH